MANRHKRMADYQKESTKSITLTVSISQYSLLEQFAESTNRLMGDVISEVFSDTAIVSIRRMLAPQAEPGRKEKYASKALANPTATKLPALATPPPDLPTPVVDHAVLSAKQPQERPMPPATPLQSSHQPPLVPPSRPASSLVAPHSRPEGDSPVPPGSRPAASGPQPNSLPPSPDPTRSPMPPLQSSTKPTDELPQKPPTQA